MEWHQNGRASRKSEKIEFSAETLQEGAQACTKYMISAQRFEWN
jgi:hypothetical protein